MAAPATLRPPFASGTRFESLQLLERGSQGEVYRARDRELDIAVALKCIGEVSADAVVQLKAEFRAAAALSHPNLVPLYDLFVESGSAYFSMELVEGVDLLAAAGLPGHVDAGALAVLAGQLCDALAALHEAGLVHRDVKPRNILVRPDGRLVLLDFGFVRDDRAVPATPQPAEGLVGTLAYMAPEQFSGAAVGSAADVYAAGAVLHEALTGAPPPPWLGGAADVATTALLPKTTPEPLRSLVASMLSVDANRRPTMMQVGAALKGGGPVTRGEPLWEPPFVGRTNERRSLREAIHCGGAGAMVEVLGASGVGKTELVRRVLCEFTTDEALVLRSHCRRSESVPFQALDAAVDDLGVELLRTAAEDRDAAVEEDAAVAAVLFPSLARVARAGVFAPDTGEDPIERRRAAVAALRRLLLAAARRRRLVVWIDDAQWADADSTILMNDLVAVSDAPPIRWVLTTRTGAGESSAFAQAFTSVGGRDQALAYQALSLQPLSGEDSASLVQALAADRSLSAQAVLGIVRAGAGYPFMLAGLAALDPGAAEVSLAGGFSVVLARSIEDLERDERRMLELVALSPQPTDLALLLEAAQTGNAGVLAIRKLESRRLVRTAPHAASVVVDSYHDQIPETLLAGLAEEDVKEGHGRLARAHQKRCSDPAILSHHFYGAGEVRSAASYAEQAGRQAEAALAFSRAAEFYRSARVWDGDVPPERVSSLLQLEGGALANAGSLAAAGDRYLQAAAHGHGTTSLELRRRAVESLLAGGRVDDALGELQGLLSALGLRYPRSEMSAFVGSIGALLSYLLRPVRARRGEPDPTELLRIDTCYSAGRRLADIDPSRGTYLLAASLARAARAGEPVRLVRSLCPAGGALGAIGGSTVNRIGSRMMADASRICRDLGSEDLAGMIDVAYGEIDMLAGRWRDALRRSRVGVGRLRRNPGYVFECNVGRGVILRALEELGEIREEYTEGRAMLEDAAAHHNSYAGIRAAQHLTIACLALGRSDEARSYLRVGFDRWFDGAFQMQHLYAARNEAFCDLYDGEPARGISVLDSIEGDFRRSVLGRVPLIRIDMAWLRGQLALAMAAEGDRSRRLSEAMVAAESLERERRPDAVLRGRLLRAGVASWTDRAGGAEALRAAEVHARGAGMSLLAAVIAYRRKAWAAAAGEIGEEFDALSAMGVGDPPRYAAACLPGNVC